MSTTAKTLRAVAYCRISRDPDGTELGVARQRKTIQELCDREGYELVDVFVDDDTSAYGRKRRVGFDAMLEAIGDPSIGIVIGWTVDRLTRNMRVGEDLIERIVETKTRSRLVINGEIDLNTSSGRMLFRILCTMAVAESELKQQRIRGKHKELLEAGAVCGGGARPFGYADYVRDATGHVIDVDRRTIVESEAKIIRSMRDRIFAGDTLWAIARDLNADGVKTPSVGVVRKRRHDDGTVSVLPPCSGLWSGTTVRQLMLSARIAGLRVRLPRKGETPDPRCGETFKADWDAIISVDDRRKLIAILTAPDRLTPRGRAPYLLTGVLRCAECGAALSGHPHGGGRRYVCRKQPGRTGCGRVTINAEKLDALICGLVQKRLSDGKLLTMSTTDDADDSADLAELQRIDAALTALGVERAQPGASTTMLAAQASTLETLKLACNDRLRSSAANTKRNALSAAQARMNGVWPDDTATQRTYIEALLSNVKIHKADKQGARFDAKRVDVDGAWRV
jgi:site-specific DNA recombinase